MGPVTLSMMFSEASEEFVTNMVRILYFEDPDDADELDLPDEAYDAPYVSMLQALGGLMGYIGAYSEGFTLYDGSWEMLNDLEEHLQGTAFNLISEDNYQYQQIAHNFDYHQYLFLELFGEIGCDEFTEDGVRQFPTLLDKWRVNTDKLLSCFQLDSDQMPYNFKTGQMLNTLGVTFDTTKNGDAYQLRFGDRSNVQHLASCHNRTAGRVGYTLEPGAPVLHEEACIEDSVVFGVAPTGNLDYGLMTRGYIYPQGPPQRVLFPSHATDRRDLHHLYHWYKRHLDILSDTVVFNHEDMRYEIGDGK